MLFKTGSTEKHEPHWIQNWKSQIKTDHRQNLQPPSFLSQTRIHFNLLYFSNCAGVSTFHLLIRKPSDFLSMPFSFLGPFPDPRLSRLQAWYSPDKGGKTFLLVSVSRFKVLVHLSAKAFERSNASPPRHSFPVFWVLLLWVGLPGNAQQQAYRKE